MSDFTFAAPVDRMAPVMDGIVRVLQEVREMSQRLDVIEQHLAALTAEAKR